MCGIVGFVGGRPAAPILLDGLSRLEYRGYDSAGVAVYDPEKGLQVVKTQGRLQVLAGRVDGGSALPGEIGLGHTRWATHGAPSDVNAHPQVSAGGRFAVVHNGIIENYAQLRDLLRAQGVAFASQTDTEVVAQLLEHHYRGDILEAVAATLRQLRGSYALGILCAHCPDRLIAARRGSPLILGRGDGFQLLASDVTALLPYTREVNCLDDGELAVLTREGVTVLDSLLRPVEKPVTHVDWEISAAEKGGCAHFMLKEMLEQPQAVHRTVTPRVRAGRVALDGLDLSPRRLREMDRLCVIACGSSYYVGVSAKYILEKLLRKPVEVSLASEFRCRDPIVTPNTLALVISQSGETVDTLAALREARRLGATVLSIVNVAGSSIARESDHVLYTYAGPEIAVATTKGYSTQLALIYLIALDFAAKLGTVPPAEYRDILSALETLPQKLREVLDAEASIRQLAARFFDRSSVFFIGRNLDHAAGLEGSLKLKEICYIHSEAYAAGELKHGPISLIEPGTLVVALAACPWVLEKTANNIAEVKSRGAHVIVLTTRSSVPLLERHADDLIPIPDTHPLLLPSLEVIPLQLFAYYTALRRGCDIDKPRNLAKSVTVE